VVSAVIGILIAIFFPSLNGWTALLLFLVICVIALLIWWQVNTLRERKNPTSQQITIAQLIEAATTKRLIL
jgi:membrane protein implicated in regulation of membrane protease activity